jgi:hypothetical protein
MEAKPALLPGRLTRLAHESVYRTLTLERAVNVRHRAVKCGANG